MHIILKSNMNTMKKNKILFFMFLVGIIAVASCGKDDDDGGDGDLDCTTVTFSGVIAPIIANSCAVAGCHNSSATAMVGDYTTYAGLEERAKNGTMEFEVITEMTMPVTGSLTQTELDQFQCWLDAGAPDN